MVKKHKKCMLKGDITKSSRKGFREKLAQTLNLTDDLITEEYKMGKTIGIGQYGTVKEAFSLSDPTVKVAVKILEIKSVSKTFKSIGCEVSSLKQANHPNIIKLLKVYKDKKNLQYKKLFLVFEYIDGIDLSDYITERIKISEDKAKVILQQIGRTIDYLHSIHICHRDIKLDNIMVNPKTLEIKLIDFGFAAKGNDRERLKGKIGTPYYVAPENLTGTYGKECDMWSIGIMTYFMLVGDPPFNAESDSELFDNILKFDVPYNPEDWDSISDEATNFVEKLLGKVPEERMSAKEALEHPFLDFSSSTQSESEINSK